MPNAASLAAIATGTLIVSVDDGRAAADPFKLPVFLRTAVQTGLAALVECDNATALTESNRAGSSLERRDALTALEALGHDGYHHLQGIPSYEITDAQRLAAYTAYGWAGGKIGAFNDARVIGLSRLAGLPKPASLAAAWRYPAPLLTKLAEQLAALDAHAEAATGGARVEATRLRNEALATMENTIARVRFYYCSASPEIDQTPELLSIGLDPRRDPQPAPPVTPPV